MGGFLLGKNMSITIDRKGTEYNALQAITDTYSDYYVDFNMHSSEASQASLKNRAAPAIRSMKDTDILLDIGSGRQGMEKKCIKAYGKPKGRFVTLDIARIPKSKLLLRGNSRVEHVRANGNILPFRDESISIVVSNEALDFMKPDSLHEIFRVTKPGGRIFVNLCFSYMDPPTYEPDRQEEERRLTRIRNRESQRRSLYADPEQLDPADVASNFWQDYLQHESLLISDPTEIAPMFSSAGFSIGRAKKAKGQGDNAWWEVDAYKCN